MLVPCQGSFPSFFGQRPYASNCLLLSERENENVPIIKESIPNLTNVTRQTYPPGGCGIPDCSFMIQLKYPPKHTRESQSHFNNPQEMIVMTENSYHYHIRVITMKLQPVLDQQLLLLCTSQFHHNFLAVLKNQIQKF